MKKENLPLGSRDLLALSDACDPSAGLDQDAHGQSVEDADAKRAQEEKSDPPLLQRPHRPFVLVTDDLRSPLRFERGYIMIKDSEARSL